MDTYLSYDIIFFKYRAPGVRKRQQSLLLLLQFTMDCREWTLIGCCVTSFREWTLIGCCVTSFREWTLIGCCVTSLREWTLIGIVGVVVFNASTHQKVTVCSRSRRHQIRNWCYYPTTYMTSFNTDSCLHPWNSPLRIWDIKCKIQKNITEK